MLLDDVFSELDERRRDLLVAELAGRGQSVITTADARQLPAGRGERASVLEVPGDVAKDERGGSGSTARTVARRRTPAISGSLA